MFLTYIFIVIVTVLMLNAFYVRRNLRYWHQFVGPRPYPLIGSLYIVYYLTIEDTIKFITNMIKNYGHLSCVWVGNRLAFNCSRTAETEIVLSSQKLLNKHVMYNLLEPWLGSGLLLSGGKKWHDRRKILTPAFHFKILEQFIEVFDKQSNILIEQMTQFADEQGQLMNIYPLITNLTLDVLCETAMGIQLNAQTDKSNEYVRAVLDLSYLIANRINTIWKRSDLLYNLSSDKRQQEKALKVVHEFSHNVIQKRRKMLETSSIDNENFVDDVGAKRKIIFLDILLQSKIDGKPLTNKEIQEEVDTFMFEGHDTTTICLSFTLFLLAQHPKVQEKAFSEIHSVLGDDPKTPVNYRNLQDLKYLELVIKESLRLYPPVPFIGRKFEQNTKINGKIFPSSSSFNIWIYSLHRDPNNFPEPDKFIPERFDVGNSAENLNSYAYIPFSAGPRNCIGQKFAMLEIKSTISKILRNYELIDAGPNPTLMCMLTLKPKNSNVMISFKRRF